MEVPGWTLDSTLRILDSTPTCRLSWAWCTFQLRICLATDAHGQALAEATKAYFVREGGRKGAWVDLAAETATVSVFDTHRPFDYCASKPTARLHRGGNFYVMLIKGTSQGARSMPSFCVYCGGNERKGDAVPCSLALNTCRVKASENFRRRCSASCRWRERPSITPGTGGDDAADQLSPMSEISAADRMDDYNTLECFFQKGFVSVFPANPMV